MSMRTRGLALCTALACSTALAVTPAQAVIVDNVLEDSAPNASVSLEAIGAYDSGILGESAAEIVAFHAESERILTVNARSGEVDILDASDPTNPQHIGAISAGGDNEINSVAVREDGLGVAAVQPAVKTDPGEALFFDASTGEELGRVGVGALPDNVHITEEGDYALLANEGEPSDELNAEGTAYVEDPEGSVSVIKLPDDVAAPTEADARVADFRAFDNAELHPDIRVFGPEDHHNLPSRDFEPEYVASANGKAWATLQENNALAIIDIESATVEKVIPAHIADHSVTPIDPSNKDSKAELRTLPVKGLSMPDAIHAFTIDGEAYFATANEGDAREWGDEDGSGVYTDEAEIGELIENGEVCDSFEMPEGFGEQEFAGNLKVSRASGHNGECFEELYAYGSRSFSIYDAAGNVIFDSGSDFEEITSQIDSLNFNADNEDPDMDDRSDNKGPEPEAVTIGQVGDRTYAFIGIERVGGVFVYDVSNPADAEYVTYVNNRDFSVEYDEDNVAATQAAGDLGPEGLAFVSAEDSPNGEALLVVGSEVSGTTTIFQVNDLLATDKPEDNGSSNGSSGSSDGSSNGSSGSSAGLGIVAAIAGLAAAIGGALAFVPGLMDRVLDMLPPQLRVELEKVLPF